MTSLFLNSKTKNRRIVLQSVENTSNRALNAYTHPVFNGVLLNLRLFLKLGTPIMLASCPPAPVNIPLGKKGLRCKLRTLARITTNS